MYVQILSFWKKAILLYQVKIVLLSKLWHKYANNIISSLAVDQLLTVESAFF